MFKKRNHLSYALLHFSMGKQKKRISPRVANQVNWEYDTLIVLCIIAVVKKVEAPWECNSFGRPCWDPKVVAVCLFMKIFLSRIYDTIEAYLKSNTVVAQIVYSTDFKARHLSNEAKGHGCRCG
jgi:LytS/YehU family sensor histidine kinase